MIQYRDTAMQERNAGGVLGVWREGVTERGRVYFWNKDTKESSWTLPETTSSAVSSGASAAFAHSMMPELNKPRACVALCVHVVCGLCVCRRGLPLLSGCCTGSSHHHRASKRQAG